MSFLLGIRFQEWKEADVQFKCKKIQFKCMKTEKQESGHVWTRNKALHNPGPTITKTTWQHNLAIMASVQ